MTRLLDTIAIVAAILTIWLCLYAYAGEAAIAPPLRTLTFAVELFSRASFWNHVSATMTAFAIALTISGVLGVALGLLLGLRRFAGDVADPILSSLYTIPKVTLYPIMLLIFGLGMSAKVSIRRDPRHDSDHAIHHSSGQKHPAGATAHGPCAATGSDEDGA